MSWVGSETDCKNLIYLFKARILFVKQLEPLRSSCAPFEVPHSACELATRRAECFMLCSVEHWSHAVPQLPDTSLDAFISTNSVPSGAGIALAGAARPFSSATLP
jgi:hypothetical protein